MYNCSDALDVKLLGYTDLKNQFKPKYEDDKEGYPLIALPEEEFWSTHLEVSIKAIASKLPSSEAANCKLIITPPHLLCSEPSFDPQIYQIPYVKIICQGHSNDSQASITSVPLNIDQPTEVKVAVQVDRELRTKDRKQIMCLLFELFSQDGERLGHSVWYRSSNVINASLSLISLVNQTIIV